MGQFSALLFLKAALLRKSVSAKGIVAVRSFIRTPTLLWSSESLAGRMVPAETVLRTVPPEMLPENSTGLSSRTFLGQYLLSGNGGGVAVGSGVGVVVARGVEEGAGVGLAEELSLSLCVHMPIPPKTMSRMTICPRHPAHPLPFSETPGMGSSGWSTTWSTSQFGTLAPCSR